MARDFIRSDMGERLLAELVPANVRVIINPTWDELKAALAKIQSRTRKNGLSVEKLRQIFDISQQTGFFSAADSSAQVAPSWYGYDYPCTQVAACHLGNGLTGFLLKRTHTPPGDLIPLPLYAAQPTDAFFDPQEWLNSIAMAFWTRLTDEEINHIERTSLEFAVVIAARNREAARQRELMQPRNLEAIEGAGKRAKSQIESFFMGVRPSYTTHLAQACRGIADILTREGRETVTWREFKQRWTSIADRYRNDLLPVITNGMIPVMSLSEMRGEPLFSLSFGLWQGSQRIFRAPQLVFRVEALNLLAGLARSNGSLYNIVGMLKQMNEAFMKCHPTLKWTAGWIRVHIDDDNRLVFVDEIQSDTLERLRQMEKDHPESCEVEKVLRPWNLHGFASICRWALAIGYSVGTHSEASRNLKAGMTQSARKWNSYYAPVIRLFDLKIENVPGYPAPIMTNRYGYGEKGCKDPNATIPKHPAKNDLLHFIFDNHHASPVLALATCGLANLRETVCPGHLRRISEGITDR